MSAFADLLRKAISDANYASLSAFARAAETSATTVSKCLKDERTPPEGCLEKWAGALGLQGEIRTEFIRAGEEMQARAQTRAQPHLESLVKENNERGRRIDKYESFFFGPRKTKLVTQDPQDADVDAFELRKRLVFVRNANRVLKERLKALGADEY